MKRLKRIFRGQSGQDMVEYGLLAGTIAAIAISALLYFSPTLKDIFLSVQDAARRASVVNSGSPGGGDRGNDKPTE